jgi:hypothetical protein
MAKKIKLIEDDVETKDVEDIMRELVLAVLEGLNVRTQDDFEDKETAVMEEFDSLKDELEAYLMEVVDELPMNEEDLEFGDEDSEDEDLDEDLDEEED